MNRLEGLDAVVVAAAFQPPLAVHVETIAAYAARVPRVLVTMLGADSAPSLKTPWSTAWRRAALAGALAGCANVGIGAVRDVPYDRARWRAALAAAATAGLPGAARIGVVGDAALADLWPPAWRRCTGAPGFAAAEAALRDELLWAERPEWARASARLVPALEISLRRWCESDCCARLREEGAFLRRFRASWAVAPYPPVFVTVDGIVTRGGEVLLVQRGRAPGQGLWALPGGFVDQHETLECGARREVAEETGLRLEPGELRAARVFDDPGRSLRGRTITHAFHYDLTARPRTPAVRGGDDASAAAWFALERLDPATLFEDHYAILQVLPGLD